MHSPSIPTEAIARRLSASKKHVPFVLFYAVSAPFLYMGAQHHPGGDMLWTGDACPVRSGVCGTVPLGIVGAMLPGAIAFMVSGEIIRRLGQ